MKFPHPTAEKILNIGLRLLLGGIFIFAGALKIYEPSAEEKNQDEEPLGREQSPTAGKPYLQLEMTGSGGTNSVSPLRP